VVNVTMVTELAMRVVARGSEGIAVMVDGGLASAVMTTAMINRTVSITGGRPAVSRTGGRQESEAGDSEADEAGGGATREVEDGVVVASSP
jgi:hypothetical protein